MTQIWLDVDVMKNVRDKEFYKASDACHLSEHVHVLPSSRKIVTTGAMSAAFHNNIHPSKLLVSRHLLCTAYIIKAPSTS